MKKQTADRLMEVPKQKKSSKLRLPRRRYLILFGFIVGIWVLFQIPAFEIKINWKLILGIALFMLTLWIIRKIWQWKKSSGGKKDIHPHPETSSKPHAGGHHESGGHGHGESFKKKSFWINVIVWTPIIIIIIIVVSMMLPHEARIAYVNMREIVCRNDYFIPHDDFRKIKIDCRRISFFLDNDKDKVYVRTKHGTYIQEYVEETSTYIKRTANGQFIEENTSIQYGNDISYFDFKALSEDGLWIRVVKSD